MKFTIFSIAAFSLMAAAAHAQTFTPLRTATVGSGTEETFLTIDFMDGTQNDSFAFGYKYDGTKTGADLLNAFTSSGLITQYIYNGAAVNGFSFDSHSEAGFAASGYWAYYKSPNGQTWSYSPKGVTGSITNGGWDGWSWAPNSHASAPITPQTDPVPEVSSVASFGLLLMLGLGSVAVQRRRKTTS